MFCVELCSCSTHCNFNDDMQSDCKCSLQHWISGMGPAACTAGSGKNATCTTR